MKKGVDSPEFLVYKPDHGRTSFLKFTAPDAWLMVPNDGSPPREYGSSRSPPSDPFRAVESFFQRRSSGFVAGWVSYEFSRLNPNFNLPEAREFDWPFLLLAYYPGAEEVPHGSIDADKTFSLGHFESGLSQAEYERRVRNIKTLIRNGYVYQINYSQRFKASVNGSLKSLLAGIPAKMLPPQSVYFRCGNHEFLSLSPERFFELNGRIIRTQPIKGTRPRASNPSRDRELRSELKHSEKDAAEHVMIVDLERNDLNRICETGSVHVPKQRVLRTFPTVHHLVSTVQGRLRSGVGPADLLSGIFPGGSVTGCPKPIAVRVIDQLEPRHRGLYTGTIGYWDLDRTYADWNIAIRTLVRHDQTVFWDSGGGIVIDSDPSEEYQESQDKVELIRTLRNVPGSEDPVPREVG